MDKELWAVTQGSNGTYKRTLLKAIGECQLNLLDMMNPMNCLPYEVCLYLFTFLDAFSVINASMVCRSWNVIANDVGLWRLLHSHSMRLVRRLLRSGKNNNNHATRRRRRTKKKSSKVLEEAEREKEKHSEALLGGERREELMPTLVVEGSRQRCTAEEQQEEQARAKAEAETGELPTGEEEGAEGDEEEEVTEEEEEGGGENGHIDCHKDEEEEEDDDDEEEEEDDEEETEEEEEEEEEEQIDEDEREELFDVIDGRHARQKKVAIGATIFADEKEIRSGSLDILVERLVADKPPETYLPVFFTTYRTFTTPKILLGMLLSLYHRAERDHKRFVASNHVPSSSSHSSSALSSGTIASISQEKRRSSRNGEKSDTRLQFRICNVLRMWMNEYFEDMLRSGGLLHYLICFIKGKLIPDKRDTLANILKTCLYNLINRTGNTSKVGRRKNSNNASERSDTTSAPTTPPPKPKIKSVDITSPRLSFCDIGEEEIARQLTLIEFEIFSRVKTYEFISPKNQPTVQEHIAFSNKVSLWAIATILEEEDAKGRAKMKARFITIASHLKHLSNYNGMISIVGALQSSALARLYDTNDELKKKRWSSAIKEQKELLAVAEAAKDICHQMLCNPAPPAIPPIAMVVSTISRLNSFHSDNFEGLINFAKRQLYCEVLFPLREYQKVPFNLCPVPQIHQLLSRQINLCRSEKQLHSLSQEREAFYESPLLSIKSEDCNLFSK